MLAVRAGEPPSAEELILRYHRIHGLEQLGDLWKNWETWFVDINESHTSLAALVHFRSPKPGHSWVTAAGAVLDLCLEVESTSTEEEQLELVQAVIAAFLRNNGHSLALTLGDRTLFQQIYDTSVRASKMTNAEEASNLLKPYGHVTVRAGGWQTPFISMELDQQKHWSESPITP
jgi:hypothetical protein